MSVYTASWLLVQVPYGVVGVSLLTAIMPRMSKAAALGDIKGVVDNLSTGSRLTSVMLIPLCAMMTVLGPDIGEALFSVGRGGSNATELGLSLTTSAFGIFCYAITMLQMRVFYSMHDARTPTLVNMIMVVVQVTLFYVCAHVLDAHHVIYGLTFVNGVGYLVGAVLGEFWLRARIGRLDTRRVLITMVKITVSSVWGAAAALLVVKLLTAVIPADLVAGRAWATLLLGTVVGLTLTFGAMVLLRVRELRPAINRIERLVRRR
jgi:putative peptidoglycan lipid II flippase